jgi:hypothetical protein
MPSPSSWTWAALQRLQLWLPAPLAVANGWFGDSKLLAHVALLYPGTVLMDRKSTYVF